MLNYSIHTNTNCSLLNSVGTQTFYLVVLIFEHNQLQTLSHLVSYFRIILLIEYRNVNAFSYLCSLSWNKGQFLCHNSRTFYGLAVDLFASEIITGKNINKRKRKLKKYGTACGYHARALVCKSYFLELLISPQTGRIEQPCNGRRAISFPDPQGVSPGVSPLTKKPEHSGNEIGRRNSSPEINEPQKQQNIP